MQIYYFHVKQQAKTTLEDVESTANSQGLVVQRVVSLTSLLVVNMLTVLVSTIFTGIFAEKMWVAFANAKATHKFFSKNISIYAISNDQSFNDTLTNDIISFEQLGPDHSCP